MTIPLPSYNRPGQFLPWALVFLMAGALAVIAEQWLIVLLPFILLFLVATQWSVRVLVYALLFLLPLSIEYQITPGLGMDLPDEALMIGLSALFLLLTARQPRLLAMAAPVHRLIVLLLLLLLWSVVAACFAPQPLLAVKYILAKCWYLVAFVALPLYCFRRRRHWIIAAGCILAPMLVLVLQTLVRQAQSGFSFEQVNTAVTPWFRNHVNYGAMVVLLLPLLLAFGGAVRRQKWRFFYIIILVVVLAAAFFSYSRGAWLAIPMAGLAVWAMRKKIISWLLGLAFVLAILGLGWLGYENRYLDYRPDYRSTIFHTDLQQHLAATYRGRDMSTTERLYRWIAALRLSADHPITGAGPNHFYDAYKAYTVSAYKTYVSHNPDHSTVHNYFLLLLSEQGLPALVLFMTLVWVLFVRLQRQYHRQTDPLNRRMIAAVTGIAAMLITVNLLSDLVETDKLGGMWLLCIAFVVYFDNSNRLQLNKV
jgi:O-antigen ligase